MIESGGGIARVREGAKVAHPARSAYARFLVFSARTGADREGQQRVVLTCSPHSRAMTAICAYRPSIVWSSGEPQLSCGRKLVRA